MNTAEVRQHFENNDFFAKYLGINLVKVAVDEGIAVMPFDERHRNGMDNVHGAAIFALADTAFAASANASGILCVNAQTSISYVAPGRVGPLRGVSRPLRLGRKIVIYEVTITDGADTLVAKATVTGYIVGLELKK